MEGAPVKKVHVLAGLGATIPAATVGLAPTAHAANQAPKASGTGKTVALDSQFKPAAPDLTGWFLIDGDTVLYSPGGGVETDVSYGDEVYVTCYYTGKTGLPDPDWDHFTRFRSQEGFVYSMSGHVADSYVDLGGRRPSKAGIPKCG
jgi:hypothetical protein